MTAFGEIWSSGTGQQEEISIISEKENPIFIEPTVYYVHVTFLCMHTVNFRRQACRRTELKHTPFTQTLPDSPSTLSFLIHLQLSDSVLLTHSLLSKPSLSFFPHRKHAGRRGGGEKKKRVGGDKKERKQRKLVEEQEGERRGEKRSEGSTRWEEGRKGSLRGLKCTIKGFCINKQIYESKPIIKKRNCRRATALRGRGQDSGGALRKQRSPVFLSLDFTPHVISSDSQRGSLTFGGSLKKQTKKNFLYLVL